MIKIKNLIVDKGKTRILDIKELDLINSKHIGIFGSNGAGKTTLVKCVLNMEVYDGSIRLNEKINSIQTLMQKNGYSPYAKVKDIIMLVLNMPSLTKIQDFISYIKFEDCVEKYVGVLSGGELQKLNLILVLMSKPDLLIIDEVSTGLDYDTRKKLLIYMEQYLKEFDCRLLLISHYKEELITLVENVITLENGKIMEVCSPVDFMLKGGNGNAAVS